MTITSIVLGRLLDHFDWQFEWSLSTHLPLQFFFPFSPSQYLCYSIPFSRALSPPSQKWCLLHMRGMMWPGPLSICDCPHEPHQSPWQCGWGCAHKAPALGEDLQCVTRLWGGWWEEDTGGVGRAKRNGYYQNSFYFCTKFSMFLIWKLEREWSV